MTDLHVTHLGDGPRVVFVHGSMSNGPGTFVGQRPLAGEFHLELVDRRGFGGTPARATGVDFDRDADDVLELIAASAGGPGRGQAHLVGHSYGAVVSLVAAGREPSLIRSLTVIEPPAFGLAREDPAVTRLDERMRAVFPAPAGAPPRVWYASFLRGLGFNVPDEAPVAGKDLADIVASMNERYPGEADPNLEAIRVAGVPALVFRGDWSTAGEAAELGGAAFRAICEAAAARLGARLVVVPGATHNPQLSHAERFNEELLGFLRDAERDARAAGDEALTAAG